MGKRNMAPLVVVGAVSAVGLIVALAGLIGHFIVDGAAPLLVSGLALLITSIAVWYGKHVPKTIVAGGSAGSKWRVVHGS